MKHTMRSEAVAAVLMIAVALNAAAAAPTEGVSGLITELKAVPKLKLKRANSFGGGGSIEIHRIKTAAAFQRLGGQNGQAIDFGDHDLVIVRGSLGCAHGKVQVTTDKEAVTFSVTITKRCNHLTKDLHWFPYASAFAVTKNAVITPSVFIAGKTEHRPKSDLTGKLKDTGITHLNLSSLGVTDDDLVKLKEFKNLTHLYLDGNNITDKGLANLSHLTQLHQLHLGNNAGITDAGLEHLKGIMTSRIQILGISETHITPDGLKQLKEWVAEQKDEFSTEIHHSLVTPQVYE